MTATTSGVELNSFTSRLSIDLTTHRVFANFCFISGGAAAYNPSTNPYASMQYSSLGYQSSQHTPAVGLPNHRLAYNTDTMPLTSTGSSVNYGLYTPTSRQTPFLNLANWSPSAPSLLASATPAAVSSLQARPSSNTGPTLHSPLTAQVYTDPNALRTQATLDMSEAGAYSLAHQHSPDQMLPECASAEPSKSIILQYKDFSSSCIRASVSLYSKSWYGANISPPCKTLRAWL